MLLEVWDFHKKMYDARWSGEGDLYSSFVQLETDFIALAEKNGLDYTTINNMLEQLYIPHTNKTYFQSISNTLIQHEKKKADHLEKSFHYAS
ncbi:hypothetical protein [Neobacillus sp. PS3-40]|uniref:hypothetical protein n=1 Tax=Neobacillus sp. PS3-40 TaxID=3070679 RepID=UPI0027E00EBC|nr:hypothetical protein [Neobacillus sp. PS3-40]WML45407.1 hypothetical protein RCG20_05760 [Neobacillus sp. PS3-40]